VNFIVDAILLLAFFALVSTVLLVQTVFPAGTQASGWTLWSIGYDGWCRLQAVMTGVLSLIVLVHLILHWSLICNFIGSRWPWRRRAFTPLNESLKTLYGVAALIVFLGALATVVTMAQFAVRPPQP